MWVDSDHTMYIESLKAALLLSPCLEKLWSHRDKSETFWCQTGSCRRDSLKGVFLQKQMKLDSKYLFNNLYHESWLIWRFFDLLWGSISFFKAIWTTFETAWAFWRLLAASWVSIEPSKASFEAYCTILRLLEPQLNPNEPQLSLMSLMTLFDQH